MAPLMSVETLIQEWVDASHLALPIQNPQWAFVHNPPYVDEGLRARILATVAATPDFIMHWAPRRQARLRWHRDTGRRIDAIVHNETLACDAGSNRLRALRVQRLPQRGSRLQQVTAPAAAPPGSPGPPLVNTDTGLGATLLCATSQRLHAKPWDTRRPLAKTTVRPTTRVIACRCRPCPLHR